MKRLCLFDIDGTLVNTGGAGQAAMEAGLARNFGVTRSVEGISTAGRTDRAITEDLLAFHGLPIDEAAIASGSHGSMLENWEYIHNVAFRATNLYQSGQSAKAFEPVLVVH